MACRSRTILRFHPSQTANAVTTTIIDRSEKRNQGLRVGRPAAIALIVAAADSLMAAGHITDPGLAERAAHEYLLPLLRTRLADVA